MNGINRIGIPYRSTNIVDMRRAAKKGHGTSLRRHTMTSILKRDDLMAIPPSRSLVHVLSAMARPPLKPILADFRQVKGSALPQSHREHREKHAESDFSVSSVSSVVI